MKNRCVYAYTRKAPNGAEYPYYIGKGTIERAYDWMHHHVKVPSRARQVCIIAKDMSDVDARQAEMLLIFLYGRKGYRAKGVLWNTTDGGDYPASDDPTCLERARKIEAEFWQVNYNWSLIEHPDGYWYARKFPKVRTGHRLKQWTWISKTRKSKKRGKSAWGLPIYKAPNPRAVDCSLSDKDLRIQLANLRYDAAFGPLEQRTKAAEEYQQLIKANALTA